MTTGHAALEVAVRAEIVFRLVCFRGIGCRRVCFGVVKSTACTIDAAGVAIDRLFGFFGCFVHSPSCSIGAVGFAIGWRLGLGVFGFDFFAFLVIYIAAKFEIEVSFGGGSGRFGSVGGGMWFARGRESVGTWLKGL